VDRAKVEQEVANAGWAIDGSFLEHLVIGNAGDLCIVVPERSWQEGADPEYELYDVEKNVSCWVRVIPTPFFATTLLQEYGKTPEYEERGIRTRAPR
jgi:hypothetical protein